MKELTELEMMNIIKNKKIDNCTEEEKKQVFAFAFGTKYMKSNDKGKIKKYKAQKYAFFYLHN